MDVTTRHAILRVLSLEGYDGQTWKGHMRNCALCHFLHVDGHIDHYLLGVFTKFHYMLCGQATRVV